VPAQSSDYKKGLFLTAFGGLALTVDIPLILLANGDVWNIMMLRTGLTVVSALVMWAVWRAFSPKAPQLIPGRDGLLVAFFYGIGAVTFVAGVFNTSTANMVFIIAFNSMFAALLSWIFLKERPQTVTLVTMALMMAGILVIVGSSLGNGTLFGDFMGLCSAFSVACALTISRASGKDMGFAALVGVILPCLLAIYMVARGGYRIEAPWWIVFNGLVIMPVSFFCIANGPKYISGPEVAMFFLLETVLAPVWVWMIFSEVPPRDSLIGGAIMIAALVFHSLWQLRRERRRARLARHPA